MSTHTASHADTEFANAFEQGFVDASDFDHRAHVRLAYVYLYSNTAEQACEKMKRSLLDFLEKVGAPPDKFHETLTRAWILAVSHFMHQTAACASADELIERNPQLLDSRIMLAHYSAEILFSNTARSRFVEPDREPIPPR